MKPLDVAEVAELAVRGEQLGALWGPLLAAGLPPAAAADVPIAATGGHRVVGAPRLVEPPVIDGRLDEAAWQQAVVRVVPVESPSRGVAPGSFRTDDGIGV